MVELLYERTVEHVLVDLFVDVCQEKSVEILGIQGYSLASLTKELCMKIATMKKASVFYRVKAHNGNEALQIIRNAENTYAEMVNEFYKKSQKILTVSNI